MISSEPTHQQPMRPLGIDVFISYSSKNSEAAKAICHVLEENRVRCWMAPRDIPPGHNYGDLIDKAIISAKVLLLVYSADSLKSHWCNGELNVAFTEEKTIVPYRIDPAPLEGAMRVILSQTHWIDSYPNYKQCFKELVQTICSIVQTKTQTVSDKKDDDVVNKKSDNVHIKDVKPTDSSERLNAKEWLAVVACPLLGLIGGLIILILFIINARNIKMGKKVVCKPELLKYMLIATIGMYAIVYLIAGIASLF